MLGFGRTLAGTASVSQLFCSLLRLADMSEREQAGFIAGDLKNAEKTLPPVIHGSMAIVMVALEFVNLAHYILLPWKEVGSTNTIAVVSAEAHWSRFNCPPLTGSGCGSSQLGTHGCGHRCSSRLYCMCGHNQQPDVRTRNVLWLPQPKGDISPPFSPAWMSAGS